ncbi:MAG: hypothetical protein JWN46_2855 [Acidimicrobiales bacterium]|nr:hypothetical protein [Acidimicrobiales bacterium]
MTDITLPAPVADDHDTGGYFQAAQRGELAVLFCAKCDAALHLPGPYCSSCGSLDVEWRTVSPTGTIYTWTVVEHQLHPAFPVPYTVALVEIDDVPGVRLVTHLDGRPDVEIGTPMVAVFDDVREHTVLPRWVIRDA